MTEIALTPSQTAGPFLEIGLLDGLISNRLVHESDPRAIRIAGVLLDGAGDPVPDGVVEIWQANAAGRYAHPTDDREEIPLEDGFTGFGRSGTEDDGGFAFVTVKPGRVPWVDGRLQAPHLLVGVFARGLLKRVGDAHVLPGRGDRERRGPRAPRPRAGRAGDPRRAGGGRRASLRRRPPGRGPDDVLRGVTPFSAIFVPDELREAVSDRAWLRGMLDAESALAQACAAIGLLPDEAAARIAEVCRVELYDPEELARDGRAVGNPAEPLVRALRDAAGADAADACPPRGDEPGHRRHGRDARRPPCRRDSCSPSSTGSPTDVRSSRAHHRSTPMAARTLLQQAVPTTFGLKAAGGSSRCSRRGAGSLPSGTSGSPRSWAVPRERSLHSETRALEVARALRRGARPRRAGCFPGTRTVSGSQSSGRHSTPPRARPPRSASTSRCSRRPRSARSREASGGRLFDDAAEAQSRLLHARGRVRRGSRTRTRIRATRRPPRTSTSARSAPGTRSGRRSPARSPSPAERRRPPPTPSPASRWTPSGCGRTSTRAAGSSSPSASRSPSHPASAAARRTRWSRRPRARRRSATRSWPTSGRGSPPTSSTRCSNPTGYLGVGRDARRPCPQRLRATRGVTLDHRLHGPEGAPVLVLSNSLGTTRTCGSASFRCSPSASACSRTTIPATAHHRSRTSRTRSRRSPCDLLGLLDELRLEKVSLCGVSLGGMVGMALALEAPERVERLVLACTSAHLGPRERWDERARVVRDDGVEAIADDGRRTLVHAGAGAGRARRPSPASARCSPRPRRRVMRGAARRVGAWDARERLSEIAAPTLVIAGEDDPATPVEHAELIASRVAGSRLVVLERAAHLANVERADAFTAAVLEHLGQEVPV